MKKIIIVVLILIFGAVIYFLNLREPILLEEEKETPKMENKKTDNYIKTEIPKKKVESLINSKSYIGPDFQPIDPPTEGLPMENEINPNFEKVVSRQFLNSSTSGGRVEIKRDGSFILVKSGFGRHVEKIGVTVTYPQESPHSFNAFADSNTGEILHTFNDSESHDQETSSIDSLWEEERESENPPNSEDGSQ